MRLCVVASKPTAAVARGFLPAAARLGLDVTVLTDQPEAHAAARPARVAGCDVWDFRAIIRAVEDSGTLPDAIFSNSDHLQVQTALAARYFGLPGKDWTASLRAKDKLLMRRYLARSGTEHVGAAEVTSGTRPAAGLRYPLVLKPAEGVASEDVTLIATPAELEARRAELRSRRPGLRLLAEEYLPGELRTLETLGDGHVTWVLGGFRTRVSPPFFAEERLDWDPAPAGREHVSGVLTSLGGQLKGGLFGAAHTEFVIDEVRGPRIIEVNDRVIGDHCEFLLSELLGIDLFRQVLLLYLGERLPGAPPAARYACAVADYVFADRAGVIAAAPPLPEAVAAQIAEPGVRLGCHPLRLPGEAVTLSGSNRDYLGVITALGDDADAVGRSLAAARAAWRWEIAA